MTKYHRNQISTSIFIGEIQNNRLTKVCLNDFEGTNTTIYDKEFFHETLLRASQYPTSFPVLLSLVSVSDVSPQNL